MPSRNSVCRRASSISYGTTKFALSRRDTRSWRKAAEQLWMILDDIEALANAMQPRETEYYRRVMELVLRRHDVLVLEGA